MPKTCRFGPLGEPDGAFCSAICMTVDEYETLRLIDLLGLTQEECAKRMGIARTTVQMIYNEARRKTADALVNSRPLHIEGGHYRLCDNADCCPAGECRRHQKDRLKCPKYSGKESNENE